MIRISQIKLELNHSEDALRIAILKKLFIQGEDLITFTLFRRAYDARHTTKIILIYSVDVEVKDETNVLARLKHDSQIKRAPDMQYSFVRQTKGQILKNPAALRPVVIGMGPCGLFAGLILAQMGLRPLILERGKAVRERTKDTFLLWRKGILNPESNVQFGEGGAGTFSDGKLYSQVKDPAHYGRKVLQEFVKAGAPEEILYVSKPHIGTFRLVSIVEKMRASIQALGGEIRFQSRVEDIDIGQGQVRGLTIANGEYISCKHLVLAIGHSARDTFHQLFNRGVYIEAKPFSIGFRIEHPQSLIDQRRFGSFSGHPLLGAADYKLVHHCRNGRTVYSFCMCPGGTVVAAASETGHLVTNGMSQYSRAERNANSGIVVGVTPDDYPGHALAGIAFQRRWEASAFELGGSNYSAPSQLVKDFIDNQASTHLGRVTPSYTPGIQLTNLTKALPDYAITAIQEALLAFDKKINGFASTDALLTGVETRTSSPIRIKRGENYQSINVRGLYPAGEGAGYAGGIYSAAIDGIKIAEAVIRNNNEYM